MVEMIGKITDNEKHHWSGWPGAYCIKCGSEDPCEIALATGDIYFEGEWEEPEIKFKDDATRDRVAKASICSVKGELKYDEATSIWNLHTPEGTIVPYLDMNKEVEPNG